MEQDSGTSLKDANFSMLTRFTFKILLSSIATPPPTSILHSL